jgi:hypothetical protein
MNREQSLKRRIRLLLALVILGLLVSGVTAFPLEAELNLLTRCIGVADDAQPSDHTGLVAWLVTVRNGLRDMYARYPWIAYGTDWLAFAHIVLAILFLGPFRDPVRNLWVIDFGLICCIGILPLALVCGPLRGIPFTWRLLDCSFGVLGFIPLFLARRFTLELSVLGARGTE